MIYVLSNNEFHVLVGIPAKVNFITIDGLCVLYLPILYAACPKYCSLNLLCYAKMKIIELFLNITVVIIIKPWVILEQSKWRL